MSVVQDGRALETPQYLTPELSAKAHPTKMRICMVFYDMQEFGGLEEYATTLAIALKEQKHQTSVLLAAWIADENQYLVRLRQHGMPVVRPPKPISLITSDWATKERILVKMMWLLVPIVYLMGTGLSVVRRRSWQTSVVSAHNWLQGQLMSRLVGPDRRRLFTRLLLHWWRLRWRPDLIHIHGFFQGSASNLLFAIDWADVNGLPAVYEEHQTPEAPLGAWHDYRMSVDKAALVVAVSEKSAQALRTVCGVTQPVVIQGPPLSDPLVRGWQRTNELTGSDQPLHVTTFARLSAAKGLTYLLEAIAVVKVAYPAANFRVYGDGELRQDLLAYAGKLGLDGQTIFVGPFTNRDELDRIMSQTDIFAVSSVIEGQPLAVVEAMAYGCAIVATSAGGIPELIQDEVNGLLCNPGDAKALAQRLCRLIENPTLRQTLGEAARRSYEQSAFQPANVGQHFVRIYEQALRQPRSGSTT